MKYLMKGVAIIRKDIDMEATEKINEMLETACLEMGWNLDK